MKITFLGTASVLLEYGGLRLLTDPVLDPRGVTYSMGPAGIPERWFSSTKTEAPPLGAAELGRIDAVLLSHDHHRDNLDVAGRAFLLSDAVDAVITTPAGERRLRRHRTAVTGLRAGASTTLGPVTITAVTAQHGPWFVPQTSQVTGFHLAAPGEPSVWISGDTVLTPAVARAISALTPTEVAIVNAGGVRFPQAPLVGSAVFTLTPEGFVAACRMIDPRVIVPVHRVGWTHFQPEAPLRAALSGASLDDRVRWLDAGDSVEVAALGG